MKLKYLLFIFFIFSIQNSFSAVVDSLKQLVQNSKNDSVVFQAHNQLVRIYISSNIDSANVFLEAQNEILLKNVFNDKTQNKYLLDWYNNSGVYNRRKGNYKKAIDYYNKAYKLAEQMQNKEFQAIELNNIANIHYTQANLLISMDYHLKALKIRKEISDTAGIAMSLGNIGLIYESRNEFEKAIENYKKSREYFKLLDNERAIAWCDRAIGVAYLDNNIYTKAKTYLYESYQICKNLENYEDMKFSLLNLASIYINQYEQNSNILFLDTAYNIITEIDSLNKKQATKRTLASSLLIKAKYNHLKSENKKALLLLDSAQHIFIELDLKTELKDLYGLKSIIFEKENNPSSALIFYKKYKAISDTIFNIEKEKEIGRKEAWFEYEEKLKLEKLRNFNAQSTIKAEKKIQFLITLLISLLLIMAVIIFIIFYRKKQNHFKQLQSEKELLIKEFNSLEMAYSNIYNNLSNIKDKSSKDLTQISINKPLPEWINDLSKRELEVLSCIAIGLTDKEIEDKLFISITTVRSHCRSIYRKLLVKNRVEAANIAKKYSLI